jgi:ribonuclease T2
VQIVLKNMVLSFYCLAVFVLLSGTVCADSCSKHYPEKLKARREGPVDFLLFVQQWAPGFCMSQKDCSIPDGEPRWTMHGVWPTSNHSEGPNYCTDTPFNLSEISSLVPSLNSSWPDLLTNWQYYCLWEHEWKKHGTCAGSITQLDDEYKYFDGVLQIRNNMDFYKSLSLAGIAPSQSNTYKTSDVQIALRKAFSVDPLLECYKHKDGSYLLYQVAFCLNKNTLSPFQCNDFVYKESTCPSDADVTYLMWQ